MLPQDYQFSGPTFLRGTLEGKLEGQALGEADAVCTFLRARGLSVSPEQATRIMSCTDLERVRHWVAKAATVNSTDELFER